MIHKIELFNFRNFKESTFEFDSKLSLITGANGSGKSSILESIFYLARNRSFRTSNPELMINNSEKDFTLRATLTSNNTLATNRSANGKSKHKFNGEECSSMLQLSENLPVLLLDTNSQRWLAAGPKNRRQLLDWGLFYGRKDNFYSNWRNFRRILLQRNAAIKSGIKFSYWDELFIEYASIIDILRTEYVSELEVEFIKVWQSCSITRNWGQISFSYLPGYQNCLAKSLSNSIEKDQKLGHTSIGPHRADLAINIHGRPAHLHLSQGQQKLLAYNLAIAQARLHKIDIGKDCIFLLDDVFAELDLNIRKQVTDLLQIDGNQLIITGIVADEITSTLTTKQHIKLDDILQAK